MGPLKRAWLGGHAFVAAGCIVVNVKLTIASETKVANKDVLH